MTPFNFQRYFAQAFTFVFYILAASILVSTIAVAFQQISNGEEITQVIIKVINGSVISIAVFELAMVIGQEYGQEADHDVIIMLRRTLPRFIGTVCVALSLEGLIMVIKYSQLDLAGNLYYPVAILVSAALLLMALGVFLKLAPPHVDNHKICND
ncbi:MAG: hypothetical protein CL679_13635 [Bermanella sp.]|nr:hypothetical protein [Bermanella sp.]|tara:strand:- start:2452 stop:2916 length:465 start_codon:yes stop_codon:yes gene_type:complete